MVDSPASPLSADWYGANHAASLRRSRIADRPGTADAGPGLADEAIDITFSPSDGRWTPDIRYRRPDLARLTVGLDLKTAQSRLGLVHSICGHAHQVAFARAGENAGLVAPQSPQQRSARACSMIIEASAAHARRSALELAPAAGHAPPVAALKGLTGTATDLRDAVGIDDPDGNIVPQKASLGPAFGRFEAATQSLLAEVPPAPPEHLLALLPPSTRDFVTMGWRRPWRFAARALPYLSQLIGQLEPDSPGQSQNRISGEGRGRAVTSRGLLHYAVAFEDGRVRACGASTPTARMTAPDGCLSRHLLQLPANAKTEALARLVVLAADPCAMTRIRFGGPGDA